MKISLLTISILTLITLGSCREERNCVCISGSIGNANYLVEKDSEKNQEKTCENYIATGHDSCELED